MKTIYYSQSISDTLHIGKEVARKICQGNIIALYGHLGSGKTVLVKGFCLGLGVQDDVTSPSYTLMNCYAGHFPIYHFDFYRLERGSDWNELGLDEFLFDDGISFIEWPDRLENFLPRDKIEIFIHRVRPFSTENENQRQIIIKNLKLDDVNLQDYKFEIKTQE